jgi:Zn-dependent protease
LCLGSPETNPAPSGRLGDGLATESSQQFHNYTSQTGGMRESFHLGTIGRTRVGLNWSVVFIVVLIAFALATSEFRDVAPGFGAGVYWLAAIVTAVLYLASILGHELSHALVARRRGVVVEGIVLWALGGVAKLHGDAPDARSEFRIAIAGPAASLAFAGTFGLMAFALSALGASAIIVTAFAWLAAMNALLAVFNLLPAYPLDGGRVLRAGLWRYWGDRLRATDAAAQVGGFLGTALMVVGIFAFLFIPAFPLNGIWLALIGLFVRGASRQERRAVSVKVALEGLQVGDAMHRVVVVAPAYATLDDLVERYMRPGRLECCALVDFNGAVAGLVNSDQLGKVPPQQWRSTRASEVAWPMVSLAQVGPGDALTALLDQLPSVPSHSALVFEQGRLVGTLTPRDIERALRLPATSRDRSPDPFVPASGR